MASYDVQTPDGKSYTVDASSDDQLNSAVNDLTGGGKSEPSYLEQTAKNVIPDIEANVKGMGNLAKGLVTHPIETIKGIPGALKSEGERIGLEELSASDVPPVKGAHPMEALKKFGEAFKEKPVTTGMDVAALFGAVSPVGEGAEAASVATKAVPAAEKVAPAAEAVKTVPIAEEAARVAPKELPPTIQDFLAKQSEKLTSKVPEDVKDFVSGQAEKVGETPMNRGTIGAYAQRNARNMAMKSLGASPGQIRKIGIPEAEKLADYAFDKGIVNAKTGDIGAGQKIARMNQDAGQVVGDMRGLATERGAVHDMNNLLGEIHGKLADKYESGIHSGEQSAYMKALEQVAKTPPTADKIAQTVTQLFQESKNLDRLKQPSGAFADVARELRSANENLLAKHLKPEELKIYHNALEDFGATTQLREFVKRKQSVEMGGRLPPGMGLTRAALQKGLDVVGYRGIAQLQNNVAKWLRENPHGTTTPKELFRHYVDEAVEAGDDIAEGLR